MGDARYGPYYRRLAESDDPAVAVRSLADAEVVAALAAASRERDPLVANILATEAINRIHRATAVVESVGEGVFAIDVHGRIIFANHAAEDLLGADRSQMVGRLAYDVIEMFTPAGERVQREDRPTALALKGKTVTREDMTVRGPTGREFPGRYTASPILHSGEVVGAVVVFQDATERQAAIRRVRESEERFRQLYDESPAMHFTVDMSGVMRSANVRSAHLLGYDRRELVGRPLLDIVHPDDRATARRAFEAAARGERGEIVELRKMRKDGAPLWIHEVSSLSGGEVLVVCQDATRIKEAEQQLQRLLRSKEEHERRHENLLRFHPDLLYGLDAKGCFTEFNPAAERATGYRAEEVLGRSFAPLLAPEDLPRAKANFARVLAGEVHENSYTLVRKDGTRQLVRLVGIPAVVDGRVVGSFGIARELEGEDPVAKRWRSLIEGLPDPGMALLDPAGHILGWNKGAEIQMQWTSGEVVGQHIGVLSSPEARAAGGADEPLRRAVAENRVEEEGWRVRKDGTPVWVKETVVALRDAAGVLQGFVQSMHVPGGAFARPPTPGEERARQQAVVAQLGVLALRGIDLRSLMDLTVKSVVDTLGVDRGGILEIVDERRAARPVATVGWRDGAPRSVPTTGDTLVGFTLVNEGPVVADDLTVDDRFHLHPEMGAGVRSGISVVIPGRPTEGHYGVFVALSTRSRSFDQDDVNFLQAVANVVASAIHRVRAEGDLREANRNLETRVQARTHELSERNTELEAFSYSASHDLRAPLRGITYLSQMLRDELGPRLSAAEREDLERLYSESERLTKLVNDLLALSRVGASSLDPRDIDLTEMAASVADELLMAEKRRVEVDILPGLAARGDPDLIRALLVNLIGNAVKYTRRTPDARVEVGRDDRGFYVCDNGAGFEPDRADRLFVAFHRLHGSEFEGTGIGLATVRRIVERHGGTVHAESPGPGLGATFHFTLPAPKGSLQDAAGRLDAA